MSDNTNATPKETRLLESLSALVDNEANELEVRRLLAESEKSDLLRTRWQRYQLARTALKGEAIADCRDLSLLDKVRAAVADIEIDTVAIKPGSGKSNRAEKQTGFVANAGRLAIAASVAGAVLLGAQQINWLAGNTDGGAAGNTTAAVSLPTPAPAMPAFISPGLQQVSLGDGDQLRQSTDNTSYAPALTQEQLRLQEMLLRQYFDQLMREHAEQAVQNSGNGLMPYARVPQVEQ